MTQHGKGYKESLGRVDREAHAERARRPSTW